MGTASLFFPQSQELVALRLKPRCQQDVLVHERTQLVTAVAPVLCCLPSLKRIDWACGCHAPSSLHCQSRLAVDAITHTDAVAWFTLAGYAQPYQATRRLL
jgi:hypothetical protein